MIITQRDVLRVIAQHPKERVDFKMYGWEAEHGLSPQATTARTSYLPAGSQMALTEDETGKIVAKTSMNQLVKELWESLAEFSMKGKTICKRSAFGQPMLSQDDALFSQESIVQRIEEDLIAAKTGREVLTSDISEVDAASLMKGFATWYKEEKRETGLGRPSSYKERIEPRLSEIRSWKQEERLSDEKIAERLGISLATVGRYKKDYANFHNALLPPKPTKEEIEKREREALRSHKKAFNSFMSFIRNRATAEDMLALVKEIVAYSPDANNEKYQEIINHAVEMDKKRPRLEISDEGLPF